MNDLYNKLKHVTTLQLIFQKIQNRPSVATSAFER